MKDLGVIFSGEVKDDTPEGVGGNNYKRYKLNVRDNSKLEISSTSFSDDTLTLRLPKEAVRILNDKFHERGLSIPMLDVALDGKVKQQQPAASVGGVPILHKNLLW